MKYITCIDIEIRKLANFTFTDYFGKIEKGQLNFVRSRRQDNLFTLYLIASYVPYTAPEHVVIIRHKPFIKSDII